MGSARTAKRRCYLLDFRLRNRKSPKLRFSDHTLNDPVKMNPFKKSGVSEAETDEGRHAMLKKYLKFLMAGNTDDDVTKWNLATNFANLSQGSIRH